MAVNDFTGQNIQDTYQKVVQTDGTNLADGTGSLLPISFDDNGVVIDGTLRANSYIVTESITTVTSGSNIFGNSSDDSHTFTGDITASGNISASSGINALSLTANSLVANVGIQSLGNVIVQSEGSSEAITISANGHITASGQISSSGTGVNVFGGDISSSATLIANEANIVGNITASGAISANRFTGDGRDLFNLPQNLAWDGELNDGFLQIITNASFDTAPGTSRFQAIFTSSLEYNSNGGLFDAITDPVIYVKDNGGNELSQNLHLVGGNGTIAFSGSNFAMDATLKSAGESSGLLHLIDMNQLNPDSQGRIDDVRLLGAIRDKLIELQSNSTFNSAAFNYEIQDSYEKIYLALDSSPQQIAVSSLYSAVPENTKVLSFHYFLSASEARGGNTGVGAPDVFRISTNPNKVYTSLRTDLDTVFRSASVTIEGGTSNLVVGNSLENTHITSSGNISSSGTIIGSNLSGTNTGDQDLSTYIQNSQTSSFVLNSATSSFLVSSDTGSLGTTIVTGSGATNITLNTTGHITASGNISASSTVIAAGANFNDGNITNVGDITLDSISDGATGGDTVISLTGTTLNIDVASATIIETTGTSIKLSTPITASGNISASGDIISPRTFTDRIDPNTADFKIVGGATGIQLDGHITASADISASGDIIASSIGIGTSTPGHPLHIVGNSPQIRLEADGNTSPQIRFLNNQSPDFMISNQFGDGGFQIASTGGTAKTFIKVGADDGDIIELSGSVHVSGSESQLKVEGNVTASGHISASGNIISSKIITPSVDSLSNLLTLGDIDGSIAGVRIELNQSTNKVEVKNADLVVGVADSNHQSLFVTSNITASGNISASGTITANKYVADASGDGYFIGGDAIVGGNTTVGAVFGGDSSFGNIEIGRGVDGTQNISLHGPVTASGIISSSTTIIANGVNVDQAVTFAGNKRILYSTANENLVVQDSSLAVNSHITASGNISASGEVIASDIIMPAGGILKLDGDSTNATISTPSAEADQIDFKTSNISRLTITNAAVTTKALTTNLGEDINDRIAVKGHLTASGNITASGDITGKSRTFSVTSNTAADYQGDIVYFGSTTSMDSGKIYAYGNNGAWQLADADHNNLSGSGLLAVALGAASDVNGMLLRGTVTLDHDPGNAGDVLYLSVTEGQATSTVPSGNGDIVRVVGYCLDSSNNQIWFNPDNTFVEVSA